MRARLMMKVVGLAVMVALTAIGAHSCSASSPASPLNPATVLQNGISGLCANQAAEAQATGDQSAQSLQVPDEGGLSNLATAAGLPTGPVACTTTTTVAAGN